MLFSDGRAQGRQVRSALAQPMKADDECAGIERCDGSSIG
jgi:hypothetical protein